MNKQYKKGVKKDKKNVLLQFEGQNPVNFIF